MRKLNNRNLNLCFTLIIINIIFFIISIKIIPNLSKYLGLNPRLFLLYKFYWTPFTHMFIHSGLDHLLFNLLMLFIVGPLLEEKMGSGKFIIYYLVTGIFAGSFSILLYTLFNFNVLLVGASGAIYALLFAYAVLFPNRKIYIFGIIPMNPPTLIIVFTVYNLYSQIFRRTNIAHITHLSGFFFAYLYFKIVFKIDPIYIFKNYKRFKQ